MKDFLWFAGIIGGIALIFFGGFFLDKVRFTYIMGDDIDGRIKQLVKQECLR